MQAKETLSEESLVEPKVVDQKPRASLEPVQVLEEYIAQHNAEVVNLYPEDRKYFHATFGCPRQAGVQAANFINAFLLAIASNRTLVFSYGGFVKWINQGENTQEECERAFVFPDWVPQRKEIFPNGSNSTAVAGARAKPENVGDYELLKYTKSWGLSIFKGEWLGIMNLLDDEASEHYTTAFGLEKPIKDDERIKKLYSLGPLFLYGMLFSEVFPFQPALMQSVQSDVPIWAQNDNVFSMALHSRHMYEDDDGSDVFKEMRCIETVLKQQNTKERCILYLMADRPATVQAISNQTASKFNCTVAMVSQHEQVKDHAIAEHGAFAGMGYYQDVVLAAHAKDAFIGKKRSSSAFVAMMMEYQRRMKAWEAGEDYTTPMGRCKSWW